MSTQRLHIQHKSMSKSTTGQLVTEQLASGLDMYGVERPTSSRNEGLSWALALTPSGSKLECLAPNAIAQAAIAQAFAVLLPVDLNSPADFNRLIDLNSPVDLNRRVAT